MNYKLLITIMVLAVVGCVKDPYIEPYIDSDSSTFTLSIESFSDEVVGSTRSGATEIDIDRGYIFFYTSGGAYKGCESIDEMNKFSQEGAIVSFEPNNSNYLVTDNIIAIFNYDESVEPPTSFSGDNLGEYFPLSADYLAAIESDMNSKTYSLGMPMYVNDFTDSDRATREVYRSVARMELFIKEGLTIDHDSHTHSIGAGNLFYATVNAALAGSVGVDSTTTTEEYSDIKSFNDSFPYSLTEYDDSAEDGVNKVYLYPFLYVTNSVYGNKLDATTYSEERFAIILKHSDKNITTSAEEPRYYKLNLLDKATSTYFDVTQNHNYRVVITAVNSRGYETLEEAYEMPPSNIEYEIYDDQGGLTYSNGQYAISIDEILSYDEVLVYGANETTIEFNNIRYVLPDGGQMEGSEFITNEVIFKLISSEGTPSSESWGEPATFNVEWESDFEFDDENKSELTSEGQSIKLTLSGDGECTIALRIRLGNLEMGRDEITIKKVATNGDGDGSFDAHPNHFEITGQPFVANSWQSDDIDFGARASSSSIDGETDYGTVIYMGENATPTGYRTMDGYVSGQYSVNSYPIFSPKTRKGYYSYLDSEGETHKVMIQLDQLAPFYLGHFGNTASDESLYHYNGLVCEKIEEIEGTDWSGTHPTNGVMKWSKNQQTYYTGTIWGDYLGLGDRYHNLVDGLKVTKNIVENNTDIASLPLAAHYCYMKNDVNGNGKIDSDEPIKWYLPAQNQVLAMWVNMNVFQSDIDIYRLNNEQGDSRTYYWSCSEMDASVDFEYQFPDSFSQSVLAFNMLEGQAEYVTKDNNDESGQAHVRCVRELE